MRIKILTKLIFTNLSLTVPSPRLPDSPKGSCTKSPVNKQRLHSRKQLTAIIRYIGSTKTDRKYRVFFLGNRTCYLCYHCPEPCYFNNWVVLLLAKTGKLSISIENKAFYNFLLRTSLHVLTPQKL